MVFLCGMEKGWKGGGVVAIFYLCTSNYKESQGLPLGETAVKIERAVFILFVGLVKKLH